MRADGRRKKKLIVAFHFFNSEQAGWRCDTCRKQGLEIKRRCGWLEPEARGAPRVVWMRGRAATEECPKSAITPQSIEWLELYFAWKTEGGGGLMNRPAREADAMMTLERELREWSNGE